MASEFPSKLQITLRELLVVGPGGAAERVGHVGRRDRDLDAAFLEDGDLGGGGSGGGGGRTGGAGSGAGGGNRGGGGGGRR